MPQTDAVPPLRVGVRENLTDGLARRARAPRS